MTTIVYRSVHGTYGRYVHVSMYDLRVPFIHSHHGRPVTITRNTVRNANTR